MPALSSLIAYRPGKKARAAIKAPFSLLRGDSTAASSTTSHQQPTPTPTEVIDINHSRYSLEIDGGKPSASVERDIFDNPGSSQPELCTSPQVELDIDLSSNGFSDWLEAFNGPDAKKEAHMKRLTRMKNAVSLNVKMEELAEGEDEVDRGGTSLQPMDASHLGAPSESNGTYQGWPLLKRSHSITIPDGTSPDNRQTSRPPDLFIGTRTGRPLSSQSDISSSALSGTTIARALMSNSFILSADRASLYRNGTGAGLTRSDSTTLPRWSRNSSVMFYNDRFSIGSDPPPIPSNAELLYEPPRKLRNEEKGDPQSSSTGSLSPQIPSTSYSAHPYSVIINPDVDFEEAFLLETPPSVKLSISRSPLPHTPTPQLTLDEPMAPDQASAPPSQEVTHQVPVLSPDSASSATSSGHTSPQELEGLLNYYSIPDSPEMLLAGGGFRPMFSPISEESSSQLSPPAPYRSDRRDSQRGLVGTRSQSLRLRDSTVLPMKDQHADLPSQVLFPGEGARSNIVPASTPTNASDSSFYFTADDNPDTTLILPQAGTIFNGQRSRSASNSVRAVQNSRDMDAYNITMASSLGDVTLSAEGVSQEFPETPNPFTPMFSARSNALGTAANGSGRSPTHTPVMSAAVLEPPPAQVLPKRASVDLSEQGSLTKTGTTVPANSGSISDISESLGAIPFTLSPTTDTLPLPSSSSEPSVNHSNISLSMDANGLPNVGQDTSNAFAPSMDVDSASTSRTKGLPSIPMGSPFIPSADDEPPSIPFPGTSTNPIALAETDIVPSSPTPSQTVQPSVPRGRLPPAALNISRHTGPDGPVAVNGTDQGGPTSAELELQPQYDSPGRMAFSMQSPVAYRNETFRTRASDIFRGTSLGSPPPYYSVVNEALIQDMHSPTFPGPPFSKSPGSDNIAGPSSGESTFSGDVGRNLGRENSYLGPRTRTRPPLPAGPRRPSQQLVTSPGPRRGSFSSSGSVVPDSRVRPPTRPSNSVPTPNFQAPTPKWKGYTMEVAKWTFTSAQLQAIVARAIRQSAEASSIRLLRLEVLDDEIPEEIQRLESQRTNIKIRYKASTRKRATILDSLYSSLSALEDVYSAHRLNRQLDELRELNQTLDRLAEEIHSVDEQLSHLESLTHIHTGSALALALRKLNSSFLKQVAENQVLKNQIQSLEAERDEAWQQAQSVANEYDQMSDNSPIHSSRVSAKRKSCIRVSRAGLRTPSLQRSPGAPINIATRSPPPPLPRRRPMDILTDSALRSSTILSTSGITPTSGSRALAQAQDELYAMLGITNPERPLHRSRSLSSPGSPRFAENPTTRRRRSSLPGVSSSLTEAYNLMASDVNNPMFTLPLQRNAVLATIDMLSATE